MTGSARRSIAQPTDNDVESMSSRDGKEKAMSSLAKGGVAACLMFAGIVFAPASADAADYVRPSSVQAAGDSGACADGHVLSRITNRFRHQVTHVPHLPNVDIVDFRGIQQNRYLPAYENRPIARRYCQATAYLSDGARHTVWYLIEEGMGFAGVGNNVEFCLVNFDRWHVYNGRCNVLR